MKDFEKALAIAQDTGDRVIVISETTEPMVIMRLKEYASLMGYREKVQALSENELLERINRDIAMWKQSQQEESDRGWDEFDPVAPSNGDAGEDENRFYLEPVE